MLGNNVAQWNMALTESRLPTGRITLTQLHSHVTLSPAVSDPDLCTLSSIHMEVYVASSVANIKHINSSLQRTMIKHWRCGFLVNGAANQKHQQQQQNQATVKAAHSNTAQLQLLHQGRQRLTFIKQYRAAYEPICVATDSLRALLQMQNSTWDSKNTTQRHNTFAEIEDTARTYYEAVAHLVLDLLPGQLFLEVYSQEDPCHIFHCQLAESEYAASCLSTHLPLHTSKELSVEMQPSKKKLPHWYPSRCIAACAMIFRFP